ncbi:CDP-archaeol synthase [Thiolapillus sp.]
MTDIALLVLLLVANGAPLLMLLLFGRRLAIPLDGGAILADGRPLFGPSKTTRGVVVALLSTMLVAPLLGYSMDIGLLVGAVAMLGDLTSSFIKRRLGLKSGAMALGLDQIPESLFPLLACKPLLGIGWTDVWLLTVLFLLADLLLSRLLYLAGFRQHPY